MDILFEYKIIQNPALIAIMQHEAAVEFCKLSKDKRGIKFPLLFVLTPVILQKRLIESIHNKKGAGSIYKALHEDPIAWSGFQKRMEAFADKTLEAFHICLHSELLRLDETTAEIYAKQKTLKKSELFQNESIKKMLAASRRIGKTFYELPDTTILETLKIVF